MDFKIMSAKIDERKAQHIKHIETLEYQLANIEALKVEYENLKDAARLLNAKIDYTIGENFNLQAFRSIY